MRMTTLCYIENDGKYLMLHRVKKLNDENKGKWIGIGGKFEEGEMPEDCVLREVKEETGLLLKSLRYRGIVTFVSNEFGTEYMHLFTSDSYSGQIQQCDEGELVWINKKDICQLNIWEGDKVFLKLLDTCNDFFSLKLIYDENRLTESIIKYY